MPGSLVVAVALVSLVVGASAGLAQEAYPTRDLTIVVALSPSGLAALTARPVAASLERLLKQPVVVLNKPGAAGNQFAATSKPDGYTLLMARVSVSVLPEVDRLFGRPATYTRDQFIGIGARRRPNEIIF